MTGRLFFRVMGSPAPQGSKQAYVRGGKAILVESSKDRVRTWREDVKAAALDALDGSEPLLGPVAVRVSFLFPRPKYHFRTVKGLTSLRDNAPSFHSTRPDADKLLRSTLDALTAAGVFKDDSQVASVNVHKLYVSTEPPGAWVDVEPLLTIRHGEPA